MLSLVQTNQRTIAMLAGLTFLSGGVVKEDDNKFLLLQGLALEQATGLADWLAVATGGSVHLRFMEAPATVCDLKRHPADIKWKGPDSD